MSELSEEELELMKIKTVDNAPVGISIINNEGYLVHVNEEFENLTGYTKDEILGEKLFFIASDEMERRKMREAIQDQESTSLEVLCKRKDRSFFWDSIELSRVNGSDYLVAFHRDMSDRKKKEEEVKRQNERLEEFASIVSHDLRNPLNVAQKRLKAYMNQNEDRELVKVSEALDRSEEIVENVRTLARKGKTVETDEMSDSELRRIVEDSWGNVDTKDASLVIEHEGVISGDRERLYHMFENLFRNAVVHGGSNVRVTVGELEYGSGFYVEDDGKGIPRRKRNQVFDKDFSETDDGSGFGLYIVKSIVEAHGWEISVTESSEGGARFEVRMD